MTATAQGAGMTLESTAQVFLAALVTALATGLGALPFLVLRTLSSRTISLANGVAAGLMLAASFGLIMEGAAGGGADGRARVVAGILLGMAGILAAKHVLGDKSNLRFANLRGIDARQAFLLVAVMTAHSFAEGVGVGVAFGGSSELATFITAAIAIHNIPEGLAISLVLVPRGVPVVQAALWSIFTSLPQPLMAVPSYLLVETFEPLLPVGLGFAAGAMLWMVFSELVPDASKNASPGTVGATVTLSFAAMLAFQYLVL
jgi:zinc transporter ZupT